MEKGRQDLLPQLRPPSLHRRGSLLDSVLAFRVLGKRYPEDEFPYLPKLEAQQGKVDGEAL